MSNVLVFLSNFRILSNMATVISLLLTQLLGINESCQHSPLRRKQETSFVLEIFAPPEFSLAGGGTPTKSFWDLGKYILEVSISCSHMDTREEKKHFQPLSRGRGQFLGDIQIFEILSPTTFLHGKPFPCPLKHICTPPPPSTPPPSRPAYY